jgi:predicted RND superfamily exporter protein
MLARRLAEVLIRYLAEFRWGVIALLGCCALLAWVAIGKAAGDDPKALFDNRIEIWFLDEDPSLQAYRDFQRVFGNDEAIVVAFSADEGETIFNPSDLNLISELSEDLAQLEHIRGVTSLSTVLDVHYTPGGDDMEVAVFYRAPVATVGSALLVRDRVLQNPLYRNSLLSEDQRTTLLTVQLDPVRIGPAEGDDEASQPAPRPRADDPDSLLPPTEIADVETQRASILDAVRETIRGRFEAHQRQPDDWHWGGLGVINRELNDLSLSDGMTFTGLSYVVLIVCLWLALRRGVAVVLAILIVHLASLFLLALHLGLGYKLNMVTMILPTLVLVIGVTDAVYFISTYLQERPRYEAMGLSKRDTIARALGFCFVPGLINSVTTSIAFLAFASSDMAVIRTLGVFAGVGIILAFVMSVTVCAVGFEIFDLRPRRASEASKLDMFLPRLLERISLFTVQRRQELLAASAFLFLIALGGVALLKVDTYTIGYFAEDHPVRVDNDFIEEEFGPYLPLEVVIDAGEDGRALDPNVLQATATLQQRIEKDESRIGNSISLADVAKRLHEAYVGDPSANVVPESQDLIEQEFIFYDPGREDDPLQLVDFPTNRLSRIRFRTDNDSASAAAEILERLEETAAEVLPQGATATPAGYVPLYVRLIDYLVEGQIVSISLTFALVFVLIAVLFRSLRYAFLSLPPNILPVLMTLGFMGYAGIDLDVGTVLIAAVALGVAVDDTIHFLFKFKTVFDRTGDRTYAVQKTIRTTGMPIVATSVILTLGFSVLCLASIKSIAMFGLLVGATMVSALIGELLVTPAILLTFGPKAAATKIGEGL